MIIVDPITSGDYDSHIIIKTKGLSLGFFSVQPPGIRRFPLALAGLVIVATGVLLYAHTLYAPWYLDDYRVIVGNPRLDDLSRCCAQIFSQRGVAVFTFSLNQRLSGTDPAGFHVVNITIHLLSAWLVFLVLRHLLRNGLSWAPLLGALLFLVHPLQTQAVTYIVQRMTSLAGMLVLLSLYFFIKARNSLARGHSWRSRPHLCWYLASQLAAGFALFAKENTIVLPLLLIMVARLLLSEPDNGWKALLLYVAPYLIPTGYLAVTMLSPLLAGGSLLTLANTNAVAVGAETTPLAYLFTQFTVLWVYIRLLLFPYGQALDHAYPITASLFTATNLLALAGLVLLVVLGWRHRGNHPLFVVGLGWFLLTLAVESTIIPLDPLFEHRLYLPVFGFVLVVLDFTETTLSNPARQRAFLCGLILIFSCLTWQRNSLWNDPVNLHEDNYRKVPQSARVGANLAKAYNDRRRYADAERVARQAVGLNASYEIAHYNLGVALYYQDRYREALAAFNNALRLKIGYADALYAAASCAIELGDRPLAERLSLRLMRLNATQGAKLAKKIAERFPSQ